MTKKDNSIVLFHKKQVRRHWDEDKELWYFSIVDVVAILTGSTIPKRYWSDLKSKLKKEGSEVYEKIVQLKLIASDGKKYATDCFSTQDLLRVIQSIPSPKAEPFKLWLAKVEYERIEETEDPELAQKGGHVAGVARREIEQKTGESVVSSKNAQHLQLSSEQATQDQLDTSVKK